MPNVVKDPCDEAVILSSTTELMRAARAVFKGWFEESADDFGGTLHFVTLHCSLVTRYRALAAPATLDR